jgi:hypothetical protein
MPNGCLCPVTTLRAYEETTGMGKGLFLTTIKPHNPASSLSIAQWLKGLLEK